MVSSFRRHINLCERVSREFAVDDIMHLLDAEIDELKATINRHKGVGCYQDNCRRWSLYLEAYEKLHARILAQMSGSDQPSVTVPHVR